MTTTRAVTILGATGSIGRSTLDVVARHPDRFRVYALTGHQRIDELAALCRQHAPRFAVVPDASAAARLKDLLHPTRVRVLHGPDALVGVATDPDVDMVMAAIVGAAGLVPTLAAARAGKVVLLANKESLVMAGSLFMDACHDAGATVLPIDSEHNAVFQCLPAGAVAGGSAGQEAPGVTRILLTASGGPFRGRTLAQMRDVTPDQACAHPKWDMGRKISVDSATLMNKGLELIEAHFLFGLPQSRLDVVVHPQSIIHSLVEYADGSLLAQLGNPDMRVPIAHAMGFPERIASGVARLDLAAIGRLDFEPPDLLAFPCLQLAFDALRTAGAAPCVLNAANEIAVDAFLNQRIAFTDIASINHSVLESLGDLPTPTSIEGALALDREARALANGHLPRYSA